LSHPTLDGSGVKAMPGRFKYPILVQSIQYLKKKKIQVDKWGTPKKYFKNTMNSNGKTTWAIRQASALSVSQNKRQSCIH